MLITDMLTALLKDGFRGSQNDMRNHLQANGLSTTQSTVHRCLQRLRAYKRDDVWRIPESDTNIEVPIKLLSPLAELPMRQHADDVGYDLVATRDAYLYPLQVAVIPISLAVAIPPGYEMQIRPRSSLASKGIIVPNSPGTVDPPYRGEVKVLMISLCNEYEIKKGTRIAQAVFCRQITVNWREVDTLDETERGDGGFGSTGY